MSFIIFGEQNHGMFVSDGQAVPCSSEITVSHVAQQKPRVKAQAGGISFPPNAGSFWG